MPENIDLRPVLRQVRDILGEKIGETVRERDEMEFTNPERAHLDLLLVEFTSAKDNIGNWLIELSVEKMEKAAKEIRAINNNINKEIKALKKVSDNVKIAAKTVKVVTDVIVALAALTAL